MLAERSPLPAVPAAAFGPALLDPYNLGQQVTILAADLAGHLALAGVLVLVLWILTWLARRAARRPAEKK